jgi:dTDP-4-dehydrorhamnose reductase
MKIFLTGKNGQLGHQLERDLEKTHEVIATDRNSLDLTNLKVAIEMIHQIKPDLIVNAAAYTQVDKAETQKDLAYQVNALAPQALCRAAKKLNIPIIHISTDYIFDGKKKDAYVEEDEANPLSIYGLTKWQGEQFVSQYPKHFILRTSWIFSSYGHNFLKTIIKLAQEKTSLDVVDDQWGSPTSVKILSKAIQVIICHIEDKNNFYGTYHVTLDGKTTWYLYAREILDILELFKIELKLKKNKLHPISSKEYFQDAMRPKNSIMDTRKFESTFNIEFPNWKKELKYTISEIVKVFNK